MGLRGGQGSLKAGRQAAADLPRLRSDLAVDLRDP